MALQPRSRGFERTGGAKRKDSCFGCGEMKWLVPLRCVHVHLKHTSRFVRVKASVVCFSLLWSVSSHDLPP
jgi:hypothetical protein